MIHATILLLVISTVLGKRTNGEGYDVFTNKETDVSKEMQDLEKLFKKSNGLIEKAVGNAYTARINPVYEESPIFENMMKRKGTVQPVGYRVVPMGDSCLLPDTMCELGSLCNSVECVGPAKTDESCTFADSAYMCESGNYCECKDNTNTECTCKAEKKQGEDCEWYGMCGGGLICNWDQPLAGVYSGKCVKVQSLDAGAKTVSQELCKAGLFLSTENGIDYCREVGDVTCTTVDDCDDASSYHDRIDLACKSGKCSFTGNDCDSNYKKIIDAAYQTKYTNNWGLPKDAPLNSEFTHMYCSLLNCIFKGHYGDGPAACGNDEFHFVQRTNTQVKWLNVGDSCDNTGRCPTDSYCGVDSPTGMVDKCILMPKPKAGDACLYDMNGNTFSFCGFEGDLFCNKVDSNAAKAVGTCEKVLGENKECFVESTGGVYELAVCDGSTGLSCNKEDYVSTKGVCRRQASLKVGEKTTNIKFCQWPLTHIVDNVATGAGHCDELSKVSCGNQLDCRFSVDEDSQNGLDYVASGYRSDGWDTEEFVYGTKIHCVSGKCSYLPGKKTCDSEYERVVLKGGCDFSNCVIESDDRMPGFNSCNSGATTGPVVFVVMIAITLSAIFM